MKKNLFSKNLKEMRNLLNYTQNDMSKKLNITRGTYTNYELGNREPSFDVLLKLSELFNISIDSLLSSDIKFNNKSILKNKIENLIDFDLHDFSIENLKIELTIAKKRYISLIEKDLPNKINEINSILHYLDNYNTKPNVIDLETYKSEFAEEITPYIEPKTYTPILYVGKVSAGTPAFAFENIIGEYNIDSSKLCNCKDYFILKVDGDSMNKLYLDGELILIERTNLVNNNDLVIALVYDDTALFKRILIDSFSLGLKPESSNPIHETKWYKKEDIHVLGKVIGALKDYID